VPTDGQHQHLMSRDAENTRQPKPHELALRQQFRERRSHAGIVGAKRAAAEFNKKPSETSIRGLDLRFA
jgi:hypothetical protein